MRAILQVGDVLYLKNGELREIEEIQVLDGGQQVYNFHVEELASYAVGSSSVLVHNSSAGNVSDVVQEHHAVPWNNQTYNHQNNPLVKQSGADLKTLPSNLKAVQGHAGRHCPAYHRAVAQRLNAGYLKVKGKGQDAALKQLNSVIKGIWRDISNGKLQLYSSKNVTVL